MFSDASYLLNRSLAQAAPRPLDHLSLSRAPLLLGFPSSTRPISNSAMHLPLPVHHPCPRHPPPYLGPTLSLLTSSHSFESMTTTCCHVFRSRMCFSDYRRYASSQCVDKRFLFCPVCRPDARCSILRKLHLIEIHTSNTPLVLNLLKSWLL